jgi:flavin-dependent dehydrogenase
VVGLVAGATFVWDPVVDIEVAGDRVVGCRTKSGERLSATWYIDASGRRSLVARTLGIGSREWEPRRIALWFQRDALMLSAGTMIYVDDESDELPWAWKIPIAPDRQSIGVVMSLDRFRTLRAGGRPLHEVVAEALVRFPRLIRAAPGVGDTIRTRTYRPRVTDRVAGANWIMAGEAAAFVDPLTSTGVATAMRHATEAAALIIEHPRSPDPARRQLGAYDRRLRRVARLYNTAIAELMYEPRLRRAVGVRWASRSYVPLGYFTSSLYTRIEPTTPARDVAFGFVLAVLRGWVRSWSSIGRVRPPRSRQAAA